MSAAVLERPRVRARRGLAVAAVGSTLGVALVAVLDVLARAGARYDPLFWPCLAIVLAGPVALLVGRSTRRGDRIGAAVLLAGALYAVKAVHDPFLTYADEWVHRANAAEALRSGHLLGASDVIPVTARFPGLAGLTSSLAAASGLSVVVCGLVVVAVARILLVLGLFVLLERASGSARVGGAAVALYAAAPNFLFWSSQYAYESLALPVLVAVLAIAALVLDPEDADVADRRGGLLAVAAAGVLLIVVTHHVTAFATVALLVAVPLAARAADPAGRRAVLWLGALAACTTAAWLVLVASQTFAYLDFILAGALDSIVGVVTESGEQRGLFQGGGGVAVPPPAERLLALAGVALLLVLAGAGAGAAWRRRRQPFGLVLLAAGLAYFGSLGLRFAPGAWETGNRASSVLFIGLALLAGEGLVRLAEARRLPARRAFAPCAVALAVASGVVAGWPVDLRLPWTFEARAGGRTIPSQPVAIARWLADAAAPGARALADETNGRTLPLLAGVPTLSGRQPYVRDIYGSADLPDWQVRRLVDRGISLAVLDRRVLAWDTMRGYYLPTPGTGAGVAAREPALLAKLDDAGADRIADAGTIALYDLRGVLRARTP